MIQDIQDFFNALSKKDQEDLTKLLKSPAQDLPPKAALSILNAGGDPAPSWRYLHLQQHIDQFSYPIGEKSMLFIQQFDHKQLGESAPQFPYLMTSITSMLVRYLAIISIQGYLDISKGNNENINVSIVRTMRNPTDNQWFALCKKIVAENWLKSFKEESPAKDLLMLLRDILKKPTGFSQPEIESLSHQPKKLKKIDQLFKHLLDFRNDLVHAEPLTEQDYLDNALILLRTLQSLVPLSQYKMCCDIAGVKYQLTGRYPQELASTSLSLPSKDLVLCLNKSEIVNLSPLLSIAQDIETFHDSEDIFFINTGSLQHLSYVGFIKGEHKDGSSLGSYDQFKKYISSIPVPIGTNDNPRIDFSNFVEDKCKYFVGRDNVLTEIKANIAQNGGHYIILKALAGMGKSSLMAHLYKSYHQPYEPNQIPEGDVWLYHFCMRTEGRDTPLMAYRSLVTQLQQALGKYSRKRKPSMDIKELSETFQTLLNSEDTRQLLEKRNGSRIIVLLDALDEAQLGYDDNIISCIPNHIAEHVVFLMSYRVNANNENSKIEGLLLPLPSEKMVTLDTANPLSGLTKEDVQEFLLLANKNTPVPDAVKEIVWKGSSQDLVDFADPFFLRFVIDGVQKNRYSLERAETIPSSLQDAFEQMWLALSPEKDFLAHRLLVTLGIMRDLGDDELFVELFNRQMPEQNLTIEDIVQIRRTIGKLLAYDGERYGLFHDRFRYFLVGEQPDPIEEALNAASK